MTADINTLLSRYHSKGVLVDTNLLLLYLVGKHDRERIERFKRTSQFTAEDYDRLAKLISLFKVIRTLPHVLAEVNSLSSHLPASLLREFRRTLAAEIETLREGFVPSIDAARHAQFSFLGLTDAAILTEAVGNFFVITTDLNLHLALQRAGADVLNFNHVRSWSSD